MHFYPFATLFSLQHTSTYLLQISSKSRWFFWSPKALLTSHRMVCTERIKQSVQTSQKKRRSVHFIQGGGKNMLLTLLVAFHMSHSLSGSPSGHCIVTLSDTNKNTLTNDFSGLVQTLPGTWDFPSVLCLMPGYLCVGGWYSGRPRCGRSIKQLKQMYHVSPSVTHIPYSMFYVFNITIFYV